MKRNALLLLLMLTLSGLRGGAQPLLVMESLSFESSLLGRSVKYSVILPSSYYSENKAYPVVYLLHGLGDDETSWLEYGRVEQLCRSAEKAGTLPPMIFVMPQAFRTYYVNDYKGTFPYQDMFVQELVPHIDKEFRTIPAPAQRAVLGYSMGGFGAMILHLKHPGIFGSAAPLSMSVRTDGQYMEEEAPAWDEQWGRLFGGEGTYGSDRITGYYRLNNPFHLFPSMSDAQKQSTRIYMVNGDEEQTLCRSNETLHILMHEHGIPHEYRVVDGGHSFTVWQQALLPSLRYIASVFSETPFAGEAEVPVRRQPLNKEQFLTMEIAGRPLHVFLPAGYETRNRKYPLLLFAGVDDKAAARDLAEIVNAQIEDGIITPMIAMFTDAGADALSLPELSGEKLRIRSGYKFRALAGTGASAEMVFGAMRRKPAFGSYMLCGAEVDTATAESLKMDAGILNTGQAALFVDAPDRGNSVKGNGELHMVLRDMGIAHEYRVREGTGGYEWIAGGMPEILKMVSRRFHK